MISVIICSIDALKFGRVTANFERLLAGEAHEIIGIHDARSLSEGYNRGIRQSRGSILVFSHDDVEVLSPDFAARLKRHLGEADVVGPAGTRRTLDAYWPRASAPYMHGLVAEPAAPDLAPAAFIVNFFGLASRLTLDAPLVPGIQGLDGLLISLNRRVVEDIAFDAEIFDGFHGYDMDFSYRAARAGYRVSVHTDIALIHEVGPNSFDDGWREYNRRFKAKHAATLPLPQHTAAPRDSWVTVGCLDRTEILRCFDPGVQRDLAQRLVAEVGESPAMLPHRSWLGRILGIRKPQRR